MNLTENFTLAELIRSDTAIRLGIDNMPNEKEIQALEELAVNILQPCRDEFGSIRVNSGFRCKRLNDAVGSKDSSDHLTGSAGDIEKDGMSNYKLALWIKDHLDFDQVILECYKSGKPNSGWVHASYKNKSDNRNQCLTFDGKKYYSGLHE